MKLFASGCSFTCGGELFKKLHDDQGNILDESNASKTNQHRLAITWPGRLAEIMEYSEFHNHSMGCGSNSRIVRKTLDFFTPLLLAKQDLSDWAAVVQWTDPMRFEYFDDESQSWALCKHDVLLSEQHRDEPSREFNMSQNRMLMEKRYNMGQANFCTY